MYCKKCGAELKEGQKFCTKCGTPVSSASNTEAKSAGPGNADPGATKDVTPKKTNTKVIAGIIAAVAVVAVIIIVVATRSGGSEEQIAETELEPEQIEETAQSEYEDEYAEDEESGLTAGEQEQLRQQEIIDNIDLDLTIKQGQYDTDYDSVYVSGTITNNNDEGYCFYLNYNAEETYLDNYGDQQTEEIESERSDKQVWVAAHETVPYYDKWAPALREEGSYVCTGVEVSTEEYGTISENEKLLPISIVSDIRLYGHVTDVTEHGNTLDYVGSYVESTITNNTNDRWSSVLVAYYVLLDGEYYQYDTCRGEYIKAGETVQIVSYGQGIDPDLYNSDGSTVDGIEIQVCGVKYEPDTSE